MPDHWSDKQRSEFKKPADWSFFIQPPGLIEKYDVKGKVIGYQENPLAENKKWRKLTYLKLIEGQTAGWVHTKVLNKVGMARSGDVVFPEFSVGRHTASNLEVVPGIPLVLGIDAARNPFATIWQNVRGSWRCYAELGMRGVSAAVFAPALKRLLFQRFGTFLAETDRGIVGLNCWVDPSATRKGDGSDDSFWSVMQAAGFPIVPAPGNNLLDLRMSAVSTALGRVTPNGDPGILIDGVNCPTLKNALEAGYILDSAGTQPDKGKSGIYADAADSMQYALLGGGEGQAIISGPPRPKKDPGDPSLQPRKRFMPRRLGQR
jgi:hypothetical protein